jgi:hypothetical protein
MHINTKITCHHRKFDLKVTLLMRILIMNDGTVYCRLYRRCFGYPYCLHLKGKVTTKRLLLILRSVGTATLAYTW